MKKITTAAAIAAALCTGTAFAQQPAAPENPSPANQSPAPVNPSPTTPDAPAAPIAVPPVSDTVTLPAGGTTLQLSLDEAVQQAIRQNPSIAQQEASIRRAQAAVAEARSFLLPRLDGDATFTLQGPIPEFTITTPPTRPNQTPQTRVIPLGRSFTKNFSLSGTYDPDPFGQNRARREVAERQVNVARGGFFVTQNELVFSVQNVYLAALRAQELIAVQQEALTAAQEQLRVAQAQVRAGTSPEFDQIRAQVQVENVRQTLETARANFRRTVASLAQVLSLDPTVRPELAPVSVPPQSENVAVATAERVLDPIPGGDVPTVPSSLEQALSEAFNRRPEVYQAEWQRRAAEEQVRVERLGHLPTVGLTASGFYNPDATGLAAVTKSWSILANVSIPIWDAGLTRARTRQAQASVDIASAQLQTARDTVAQEVKTAVIDLNDASVRRRTAAANVVQAREALRIAHVRYTAGLATSVEVTDAEAALTQARANEVNAAYDYLGALAELNRSLGVYASDTLTALRPSAAAAVRTKGGK